MLETSIRLDSLIISLIIHFLFFPYFSAIFIFYPFADIFQFFSHFIFA